MFVRCCFWLFSLLASFALCACTTPGIYNPAAALQQIRLAQGNLPKPPVSPEQLAEFMKPVAPPKSPYPGSVIAKSPNLIEQCAQAKEYFGPGMGQGGLDPRSVQSSVLQRQGLVDEAYHMLLEGLCAWPLASDKTLFLFNLRFNRQLVGDLPTALKFLEWGEALQRLSPKRHDDVSNGYYSSFELAGWYERLGDELKLRDKTLQLQSTIDRLSPLELQQLPRSTYLKLAELYVAMGDFTAAERERKRWAAISGGQPALGRFGADEDSAALLNLSYAYWQQGRYQEGKEAGELVFKFARYDTLRAMAAISLATIANLQGNGAAAIDYLAAAEKTWEEDRERRRRESQRRMAQASSPAEQRIQQALQDTERSVDFSYEANLAWQWGQAYALAGRQKEAVGKLAEAVNIVENLRGFLSSSDDRLKFFAGQTGAYYSLVDILSRLDPRDRPTIKGIRGRDPVEMSFYVAEAARARSLAEQLANSTIGQSTARLSTGTAQRERELLGRARQDLLEGTPFDASEPFREYQQFIESLRKNYPEYAALKYPLPVTSAEVPLTEREVLLAYALLKDAVVIWRLQKDRAAVLFRIPVTTSRVTSMARLLRASLEPRSDGTLPALDQAASQELFQWLLAEPLKGVSPGTRIIIAPDAALASIPFELLSPAGTGGVGQRYSFFYTPSATVLTYQRRYTGKRSAREQAPLLAVGDPVYERSDARAAGAETGILLAQDRALRSYSSKRRLGNFARIPGTEREIRRIAAVFNLPANSTDVRLGLAANEADLKSIEMGRYRFLHFATHGVLAGDLPYVRQPAIALSQIGDLQGEDGLLTADEVLKLKLDAELTVLSACQTGLGEEVSGEGVVGLTRAFLLAGSRAALVSLWKVDDEATAVLMGRFYELVKQGRSKAEALQQTKRELSGANQQKYQHPFFWAAFVLYGAE